MTADSMGNSVTVYYFTRHDLASGLPLLSQRRATLDAIARARGTPMMETALDVDEADVDDEGFMRRDEDKW